MKESSKSSKSSPVGDWLFNQAVDLTRLYQDGIRQGVEIAKSSPGCPVCKDDPATLLCFVCGRGDEEPPEMTPAQKAKFDKTEAEREWAEGDPGLYVANSSPVPLGPVSGAASSPEVSGIASSDEIQGSCDGCGDEIQPADGYGPGGSQCRGCFEADERACGRDDGYGY